jgi:SanA protein
VFAQLRDVLPAENSAIVPQKYDCRRSIRPETPEQHFTLVGIRQRNIGKPGAEAFGHVTGFSSGCGQVSIVNPRRGRDAANGAVRYHESPMLRKAFIAACLLFLLCAVSLLVARLVIGNAARGRTYSDVSQIPHRHVGLVLGCPRRITGGWSNPFFENRMTAAADLYHSDKVDYLIVSGDNHIQGYDEPTDMKNALIERGVPKDRIYLDYAGLRTLDSVIRVKQIFLQSEIIVISQHFHNQRAIFLASHHDIDAIGFDAPDVALQYGFKTLVREQFAKVKAVLDIYALHTQPHFLGRRIAVGGP